MKSVVRDHAGISSPTFTSSKCTLTAMSDYSFARALLVPDAGGDASLDVLALLVGPLGLGVGEEGQAEARGALVPVLEARARRDHIAGPNRHAEGLNLAAVHPASAHTTAGRTGAARC